MKVPIRADSVLWFGFLAAFGLIPVGAGVPARDAEAYQEVLAWLEENPSSEGSTENWIDPPRPNQGKVG